MTPEVGVFLVLCGVMVYTTKPIPLVAAPPSRRNGGLMDVAVDGLTVGEYLERWLAHARGRVRTVTYEGYEVLIRCHAIPMIGELVLGLLTPIEIQDLYRRLLTPPKDGRRGLSAGSVLTLHLVLPQAFGQAVRWQLLAVNPAAGAQPPRPRRAPRIVVDAALLAQL